MAERIKNIAHPLSPTSRKAKRVFEANGRQEIWDNMTNAEKLEQLEARGMGNSSEAEKYSLSFLEKNK